MLRFDDTNPEAEDELFFDMIINEVKWLGHKYREVTYSSAHFGTLHYLAVKLIKSGDAYVCDQTSEEVRASRSKLAEYHVATAKLPPEKKPPMPKGCASPYRNRSVEENLRLFERMRQGRVPESGSFLRFKGDLHSSNANMWDLAAYRVKFTSHPAAGDEWCIYPTYDFTHCIIDSLEGVTHSLCTLEFESRQAPDGSYYWLLDRLGMYKPATWEYGRLNITHHVLSKRRLNFLVTKKYVSGWDDPRLLTLAGLRRRGYSPQTINAFCDTVGVTRSDGVLTRLELLESHVRSELDTLAPRVMVVLRPLRVVIDDYAGDIEVDAKNHPKHESMGTHRLRLTKVIYIEQTDFRLEDDPNYFGLAPGAACIAPAQDHLPSLARGAQARRWVSSTPASSSGASTWRGPRTGGPRSSTSLSTGTAPSARRRSSPRASFTGFRTRARWPSTRCASTTCSSPWRMSAPRMTGSRP